jgi:hypothetical protein
MPERSLDAVAIGAFLDAAADGLDGTWVVVGGAAAAAWFDPGRVTQDIDIVPLEDTSAARLALLDLADAHGLPIESVNSAASWFLRRIPGWEHELDVLRQGRATLLRPNATLFLLLKAGRLSESDSADCERLLDMAEAHRWPLDRERVLQHLDGLPPPADDGVASRRESLRRRLLRAP